MSEHGIVEKVARDYFSSENIGVIVVPTEWEIFPEDDKIAITTPINKYVFHRDDFSAEC